ncbi:MAG: BamA/TamA family outer membrane protein [Muribaculaceae bacterium]|nr:BamA/TamA family outer membrane protein [Muribaculaceae bacterium]
MKKKINHILATARSLTLSSAVLALLAIVSSCSTTRRLPSDEILYTGLKGVEFNPDNKDMKVPSGVKSDINDAVDVKANKYTFTPSIRIPVGLWVYNNWNPNSKGIKKWLYNKLVEDPVLISDVRPEVRTKMIDEILDNNGFFQGTSSYQLNQGKNKKKASLTYIVNTGPAYNVDTVEFLPDTCHLYSLLDSAARQDTYLGRLNMRYSTDSLSTARTRLANIVRNRGYYYFRPEYIEYLADSIANPGHISLRMTVASNVPKAGVTCYRTGKVTVYAFRHNGGGTPDTIHFDRATLIQMQPSRLRHNLIPECVTFRKGRLFSVRSMNQTQNRLSRLGIFNSISIDVSPDSLAKEPTLDATISCTFDTPLEASIEVNASSKSNSYIGPGVTLGVTNKNIFGGGEQFSISLTGTYEWQTGGKNRNHSSVFNSYEVGLTTSLAFPRMIAPKFIPRRHRQLNWTRITLNADLLNRPHYFKMAQFNASFNYDWQSSRNSTSTLTPFKITYTNLIHTTALFDSITAANPAIALSFRSQYIPQMAYTYNYMKMLNRDNSINWTFTVQEAGNIFWSIYELCGKHGEKKLFGTPFSQFVKGQTQVVYGRRLSGDNWIYTRAAVGAAHAYGNSSQVPYAEQFYVGGANSVRAFTVRSLGPGSYRPDANAIDGYFDQTGTFKFEFNVEYRFPIFGPLHGALFLDSGNIWLLKEDPQRPGGLLRASTFFKDLAVGTGAGLRFDIGMLVVRGDLGIGIHAPYDTGKRGYYNMTSFGNSLAFHLAIGYPF